MKIGNEQVFATRENSKMNKLKSYSNRDYSKMSDKRTREVSQEFEALFINELFKSMRKTVGKDKWLHGGLKQDIFEDMLYSEYAKESSRQGGIGLGKMVFDYLKQTQK